MPDGKKAATPAPDSTLERPSSRPAGLEAPLAPSADPSKKTSHTSDPKADDPGNGAD